LLLKPFHREFVGAFHVLVETWRLRVKTDVDG
jgi:hypothetical protein